MSDHHLVGTSPGRCWECGSPNLRAVDDGQARNFLCPSCSACWHVESGHVSRVDPRTCPGCTGRPCNTDPITERRPA